MSRIYVCHTFYHVYVSILKEMKLEREDAAYEKGDIALSSISTDFGDKPHDLYQGAGKVRRTLYDH